MSLTENSNQVFLPGNGVYVCVREKQTYKIAYIISVRAAFNGNLHPYSFISRDYLPTFLTEQSTFKVQKHDRKQNLFFLFICVTD